MFELAFSNAGACAPARLTLVTGMYPPAIGTQQMRSQGVPPSYVRVFTEFFRKASYYKSNHSKTAYVWDFPDSQVEQLDGQDFFRTAEWKHWVLHTFLHQGD